MLSDPKIYQLDVGRPDGPRFSVYGAEQAPKWAADRNMELIDWRGLDASFIISALPAGIHIWDDGTGAYMSSPFVCKSQRFNTVQHMLQWMATPPGRLHYVLYAWFQTSTVGHKYPVLRSAYYEDGSPQAVGTLVRPHTMDEWIASAVPVVESVPADPMKYPHICPRCKSPAYIGFNSIDCSRCP